MFTIKAKYNTALVMLDDETMLDGETTSQIYSFLNHPAFAGTHIAIMPDCHSGKGAVVGFTMKLNNYLIPNVVGVDVGCGVLAIELDGVNKIDYEAFDKAVNRIPSGFSKYPFDTNGSNKPYGRNLNVCDTINGLETVANAVGTKYSDVVCALGTLGGGNHFIEVDYDELNDKYWLVIHTGSRNFGLKFANFMQNEAKKLMKKMFTGDAYRGLEFLTSGNGYDSYITGMEIAQKYASMNRFTIAKTLVEDYFKLKMKKLRVIESIHNYIDTEKGFVRKGAISAQENEDVIIPLNMRDGTIIGAGKGNKAWNYSAPHGAGRILSRKKAKESLSMDEYKTSMNGIYSSCVVNSTIDEAPMAYKDKDLIINAIKDTVEIKNIIKPVYNFKAKG